MRLKACAVFEALWGNARARYTVRTGDKKLRTRKKKMQKRHNAPRKEFSAPRSQQWFAPRILSSSEAPSVAQPAAHGGGKLHRARAPKGELPER